MNKKPKALREFLKTAKQNHSSKIAQTILFDSCAMEEAAAERDTDLLIEGDAALTSSSTFHSPAPEIRHLRL